MMIAATTGFATAFSLILAIGAQNAFVLRQGLLGAHVFWVCLLCALSDAVLISTGVLLADSIGGRAQWAIEVLTWAGAAFLIAYGAMAAWRASTPGRLVAAERSPRALGSAMLTCAALTWLNPHVYLDTVGLIGAVSMGFEEAAAKAAFGGGAVAASFAFFFTLGYGARLVAPSLSRPGVWAMVDVSIAVVMWSLAATLIATALE